MYVYVTSIQMYYTNKVMNKTKQIEKKKETNEAVKR